MDTLSQPSTQTLSNLGIGAGLVAVPESRVYRTADGSRTAYYRAGDQITRAEAELYGIVDPVAVAFVGDDAAHGERIAGYLQAAGFSIAKAEEFIEAETLEYDVSASPEFGEMVAAALRAAGYELPKGRRTDVDGVAVPVAEVELGTLVASEAATREAAQTAGGQTEGHVTVPPAGEAKQEPEAPAKKAEGTPANKAEPKPANKAEPKPATKKG